MPIGRDKCRECGNVTLRISWSGLRTHDECKQRGYLTRTGKKATLDDQRNFLPGNITDRVVRDWLNDPDRSLGAMPGMVGSKLDEILAQVKEEGGVIKQRDPEDFKRVREECIEAVTKIEPELVRRVLPFDFQPDFKFTAPVTVPHPDGGMETVNLIGFMDIIVRDSEGRFMVWDVKHTRDEQYWRKTVGQLGFYDLAVELMFGQPTVLTGLLQPMCKKPVMPYTPSVESRAQLMTRVVRMADDIWRDEKTPRVDNTLCGWCPVRHACSKFAPVMHADGKRRMSF